MYARDLIKRYDFHRVSALKLDKNQIDPNDMHMKYELHPEKLKQIPLREIREHPDFVSTSKATYRPFAVEVDVKNGGANGGKTGLNTHLFQPDYAHNDNTVFSCNQGSEILRLLQGKRA